MENNANLLPQKQEWERAYIHTNQIYTPINNATVTHLTEGLKQSWQHYHSIFSILKAGIFIFIVYAGKTVIWDNWSNL